MCETRLTGLKELEAIAIFGFDGKIQASLKIHPDRKHMLFPLGNKVSIINLKTNKQEFLCGHTNNVSTIDVSPSGQMVASGQISHMGFRAYVIIWNWANRREKSRHELHKVRIESVCFTSSERYLISLGGRDCGMIIIWDIEKSSALCGATASKETTGDANRVQALKYHESLFISDGEQTLRLWSIARESKRLIAYDVALGKLRREFTSIQIDPTDDIMYVGTMSGDIVKIKLNCHPEPDNISITTSPLLLGCFACHNPKKPPGKDCTSYSNGVRELYLLDKKTLLIGTGNGIIDLVEERNVKFKDYPNPTWPQFKSLRRTQVNGSISSFDRIDQTTMLVGTESCEIYSLNLCNFEVKLLKTCHTGAVYDIAFPHDFSLVFATASYQSIRIWSTTKMQELLRIMVPNFSAASIVFSRDGKSIISAWNDGILRAFTPLTGKLIYAIPNAHNKGCSAVTISSTGKILVSGGCEGQVRVWRIDPLRQSLIGVLKEHTAAIASVEFNKFDSEVVSASSDGSCIIWDIIRLSRKHVLFANTQFTCARYFPTGVQLLAAGSDRRISYWEVYDASLAREVEGSIKGVINCVSLCSSGEYFVSVGNDQIVKLWDYQSGIPVCAGYGHAAVIVTARYSPCSKFIVSGSADGAIFIWKIPKEYLPKNIDPLSITSKKSADKINDKKKNENKTENITQLETQRSNKSQLQITECPPVDSRSQPTESPSCIICEPKLKNRTANRYSS